MPVEVGLGLGSNEGDRVAHLARASQAIAALPGLKVLSRSSLYETEPVGVKPEYQHLKFINAVMVVVCEQPLPELQKTLLGIEQAAGRNRSDDKYAPRPLDIDILYAGSMEVNTPELRLPHPQCRKRRFVLEPLAEVCPDMVLPGVRRPVRDLLAGLSTDEQVVKLPDVW